MLHIVCGGSPYEIGKKHGETAAEQVNGSISFYEAFFLQKTKKTWAEVEQVAKGFLPYLEESWSEYVQEMQGLADGAKVNLDSILALNVRTEIGYGLLNDGCSAFSWKSDDASFIAQNWDWEGEQQPNLISLTIKPTGKPVITMMTEAGIIGKIGLNSEGVGVTLNAISAPGMDMGRLPTHLALRTVLESTSQAAAKKRLLDSGVAAACHITIADLASGGVGLECSSADIVELDMVNGICTHTNHMLRPHKINEKKMLLQDSPSRNQRLQELLSELPGGPSMQNFREILKDEKNYPAAICRAENGPNSIKTLFSIVMDLKEKYAVVKMGRPTENGEEFELRPWLSPSRP